METINKLRTFNICLSDIPKERMFYSEKTGKYYINLDSYDYDQPNQYGQDFSLTISLNQQEREDKKNGQQIKRIFVGNGKIFKSDILQTPLSEKQIQQAEDHLPF